MLLMVLPQRQQRAVYLHPVQVLARPNSKRGDRSVFADDSIFPPFPCRLARQPRVSAFNHVPEKHLGEVLAIPAAGRPVPSAW